MERRKTKMAKTKATLKTDDGTIARDKVPPKPTPPASQVEKTESFTAAFKVDAHAAADYFLADKEEELSREETDSGNEGIKVTITYK